MTIPVRMRAPDLYIIKFFDKLPRMPQYLWRCLPMSIKETTRQIFIIIFIMVPVALYTYDLRLGKQRHGTLMSYPFHNNIYVIVQLLNPICTVLPARSEFITVLQVEQMFCEHSHFYSQLKLYRSIYVLVIILSFLSVMGSLYNTSTF